MLTGVKALASSIDESYPIESMFDVASRLIEGEHETKPGDNENKINNTPSDHAGSDVSASADELGQEEEEVNPDDEQEDEDLEEGGSAPPPARKKQKGNPRPVGVDDGDNIPGREEDVDDAAPNGKAGEQDDDMQKIDDSIDEELQKIYFPNEDCSNKDHKRRRLSEYVWNMQNHSSKEIEKQNKKATKEKKKMISRKEKENIMEAMRQEELAKWWKICNAKATSYF